MLGLLLSCFMRVISRFILSGLWLLSGGLFLPLLVVEASDLDPVLVDFRTGAQVSRHQLISDKQLLVYIEKDCASCASYIHKLGTCDESVKKSIQLVSMNTPAQTKSFIRTLPKDLGIYVAKNPSHLKNIQVTPTTQGAGFTNVGPLSCEEIETIHKQ